MLYGSAEMGVRGSTCESVLKVGPGGPEGFKLPWEKVERGTTKYTKYTKACKKWRAVEEWKSGSPRISPPDAAESGGTPPLGVGNPVSATEASLHGARPNFGRLFRLKGAFLSRFAGS